MDFINHYLTYNSGNMVPKRFHMWSSLAVLSLTAGRRFFVEYDYYQITPMTYICLVGPQGTRKSTAKDIARDLFSEALPDFPIGANVMSREQIVCRMCEDESARHYTNEHGALVEWRPMGFFVNELKNFLSIDPSKMIEFLTDVYDQKFFRADTIKHGLQPIINPFITVLACETPDWIVNNLKIKVISGGFARRMLFVYVSQPIQPQDRITFPKKTPEMEASRVWCVNHLKKITKMAGEFKWTPDAREFFSAWHKSLPIPEDPIIAGFYEAKDVLAQKITMLLALSQTEPKLEFTVDALKVGIATLEAIEDNLPRLTAAAGRNMLAVPQQQLLEVIRTRGGMMSEKEFHLIGGKMLTEMEYHSTKQYFLTTDQLFEVTPKRNGKILPRVIVTPEKRTELLEKGELERGSLFAP